MSSVNKHEGSGDEGGGIPTILDEEHANTDAAHSTEPEHLLTCECPVAEEAALVQAKAALTKAQMVAWTVKFMAMFMLFSFSLVSFVVGYQLVYGIDPDALAPVLQILGYVKDIVVSLMKVIS